MSPPNNQLDPRTHAHVFHNVVIPESGFHEISHRSNPRAIILAGQPGAGKGGLARNARSELDGDAVTIDPDVLRDYHPEVENFRSESPYAWAGRTHADASQWAKELRAAAIDGRKNLILDTTLGDGDSAIELIRHLQGKGYTVDIRAMASPRLESELGVEQRFSDSFDDRQYGRYVPNGIRDDVYEALPKNLDKIQAQTDVQIRIFNREGAELFDNRTDTRLPSVALGEARESRLRDPVITRTLRDGWKGQQGWHHDLPETLRDNPRVDSQTGERLLTERAQEGVVERMNKTAKEAFDVDHATRIRPAQIRAGRVLGIASLAIDAYDGAQTYRTVSRLRGEGNDTAAESELIHFGSRSIGGLGGAAVGAGAGGLATSWSGPGMLIGGGVGGIVGVFGGEKFAEWTDNHRIYNQEDGRGNTWTFDSERPERGWERNAPIDASNDGIDNARQGGLRASPMMANELNYKATSTSVKLILGGPPPQRDPFTQAANGQDTPSSRPTNWQHDADSGAWTRTVYGPYIERGMTPYTTETASPERAAQLDRAAAQIVVENAANSPASIAARYEDAYIQNGWARFGPMPEAVRDARTDIDKLVASDENRYQRQADGRWVSEGMIYDSTADGRLQAELEATRTVLQTRLPAPREVVAPAPMTAQERLQDAVAGAYLNAGIEASPERIAAAAIAVRATWNASRLDPETTAPSIRPDASGGYGLDSPIGSMQLEADGRTYRIAATTSIEEIREAEAAQRQPQQEALATAGQTPGDAIPTLAAVSATVPTGMRRGQTEGVTPESVPETRVTPVLADNASHPDHDTFNRIHQWVRGTGQWDEDKSRNIASALYKEQSADPMIQRVDKVTGALGKNGEENVFAVYAPYGDKGPFLHARVDGREAGLLPAEQSLQQAEQIKQQFSEQQQLAQRQQQDQQAQRGAQMAM